MNNTKYDPQACKNKILENEKYKNYVFSDLNQQSACFPISGSQMFKERNSPPSKPEDIETESYIRGYTTPLSKVIGLKKLPPAPKKTWGKECDFLSRTETRETGSNKLLLEKDISSFNVDYLPYNVQNSYRDWQYINSRQMIKDIQEKSLKKK